MPAMRQDLHALAGVGADEVGMNEPGTSTGLCHVGDVDDVDAGLAQVGSRNALR